MKKFKLILMMALLLTTVLLLASCGTNELVDLVDQDATPVQPTTYTAATAVSALTDMTLNSNIGNLQLFTKTDVATGLAKYVVYDVANDNVVFEVEEKTEESATARNTTNYNIVLSYKSTQKANYFRVEATNTAVTLENSVPTDTKKTTSTAIWAWNGSAYAELVKVEDPRGTFAAAQDLIYFEGKVYRADENGVIAYAFDYSPLAKFPTLTYSTENYYVAEQSIQVDNDSETYWITYDKELQQVATYQVPSYANIAYRRVIGDKIFIQYYVDEDRYGDSYDLLLDADDKATLYTLLVDAKTGKAKDLESEYVVMTEMIASTSESWEKQYGFATVEDETIVLVQVQKIENKHLNTNIFSAQWAILNEKGEIQILELPVATQIQHVGHVGQDLWMILTVDNRIYLVDGDGEIKGEVTNYEDGCVSCFAANGKLYDMSMNEIYDYQADKLTIVRTTPKAFMFTNADNELIIYANGEKTTLINKDAAAGGKRTYSVTYSKLSDGYFVIEDTTDEANTKYEIYNIEGKLIKTVDQTTTFGISSVASAKDGAVSLVKITTKAEGAEKATATYYRFS